MMGFIDSGLGEREMERYTRGKYVDPKSIHLSQAGKGKASVVIPHQSGAGATSLRYSWE
jgi:hypothetical protein